MQKYYKASKKELWKFKYFTMQNYDKSSKKKILDKKPKFFKIS
jgi:hypothetical protein